MYYISMDGKVIGSGLSKGELNQWILELEQTLPEDKKSTFRKEFGFADKDNFVNLEHFLYDTELNLPIKTSYKDKILSVYKA